MDFETVIKLPKDDQLTIFFHMADKGGLVKDGKYIDGIPNKKSGATEKEINLFYALEDWLGYPKPKKIAKKYLNINKAKLKVFFEDNKSQLDELMFDLVQEAIEDGENACKEFISDYEDSTMIYHKWEK